MLLQAAAQLRASYVRIRNMTQGREREELVWARNEVRVRRIYFADVCL